jgi:hypothetical protein
MRLVGFDLLFWPPVYRDRDAERHELEQSRGVDDDIRIAIRRPAFGLRRFTELRFIYRWCFWLGWLEIRRLEREGSWCCPDCDRLNPPETRTCACGHEWGSE